MVDQDKKITFYYYTAWDGFAWQGCDEAVAKSLQRSMEATKTLPNSPADRPPFGGAVLCKIGAEVGVAVYRYHTREKGDLSGRDSLYIALAFVPLRVGCVDFARLLDRDELAKTKIGALKPEEASVDGLFLPESDNGMRNDWLDRELDSQYQHLAGRHGLAVLSRLFFSEQAQLGFLNAVFSSDHGVDGIVSDQTYMVNPTVQAVAKASKELQAAKRSSHGVLAEDHPAKVAMKNALADLDVLAKKQSSPGYQGLQDYHDAKKCELYDDAELLKAVREYRQGLQRRLAAIESARRICYGNGGDEELEQALRYVGDQVRACTSEAEKILAIPVLGEDNPYRRALQDSMKALEYSNYILGVQRGIASLQRLRDNLNSRLANKQGEVDRQKRLVRTLEEENARLGLENKELRRKSSVPEKERKADDSSLGRSLQPSVMPGRSNKDKSWGVRIFDWAMSGMIVLGIILLLVLAVLIVRMMWPKDRQDSRKVELPPVRTVQTNACTTVSTNSSPEVSQVPVKNDGQKDVEKGEKKAEEKGDTKTEGKGDKKKEGKTEKNAEVEAATVSNKVTQSGSNIRDDKVETPMSVAPNRNRENTPGKPSPSNEVSQARQVPVADGSKKGGKQKGAKGVAK